MMIDDGQYNETTRLYRSDEGGDHLVFQGTAGWRHRIYPNMVTVEKLPATIEHLRTKSWMNEDLLAEFEVQALLLRG